VGNSQKPVKLLLQVLVVTHVAGNTNDSVRAERVQALNVAETGQRAVRR
jgi:hypothetical protein